MTAKGEGLLDFALPKRRVTEACIYEVMPVIVQWLTSLNPEAVSLLALQFDLAGWTDEDVRAAAQKLLSESETQHGS